MIGRLFKQNSSSSLNLDQPQISSSTGSTNSNTYEDIYTRQILYGVSGKEILNQYDLNSKYFRILISQDGGNLRSKQILFDTENATQTLKKSHTETVQPKYVPKSNLSRTLSPSIHHNTNELHEYMFGCGVPTNEQQSMTKIHHLPVLSSTESILITRLFLISDLPDEDFVSTDWIAKPTLPLKDSKIHTAETIGLASRFGIGLVIPIHDDFFDIVISNWNQICHYLIILQKIISKKLINLLLEPNGMNHIINKRIQFTPLILANDIDLNNHFIKLVKLINYDSNIPKLVNSNSLINLRHNSMMMNWTAEILNWLEFKDESYKFLACLLALIIPLRKQLLESPIHYDWNNRDHKEITRIVIMTGNILVAKKLVFILNGLIPDDKAYYLLSHKGDLNMQHIDIEHTIADLEEINLEKQINLDKDIETATILDEVIEKDDIEPANKELSKNQSAVYMPVAIKPIPIKGRGSFSSSENSYSTAMGWEIPGKATTSTSVNSLKKIPMNRSLNRSSSMAYLSSSLNSSLSSTSNYSLSKLGGSFIEKWRNSFNNSLGMNFDSADKSPVRKTSIQILRNPSPAIEVEEFKLPTPRSEHAKMPLTLVDRKKNILLATGTCKKKVIDIMNQELFEMTFVDETGTIEIKSVDCSTTPSSATLVPVVPYTDEFRPEFTLQSCAMNPRLEQQIISSMKNDLLFYQNNCDIKNVSSKTILVSLRAREIKTIQLQLGGNVLPGESMSPLQSYFSDRSHPYKTTIKKVFTPQKSSGDMDAISAVEIVLNELNELFDDVKYNDEFYDKVYALIYKLIART